MADAAGQSATPGARLGDDRIQVTSGIHEADLGGEIVLLHPVDGSYFALNETGACLWRELGATPVERDAAIERATAAVTARWAVEAPVAAGDLRELLDELLRRGLAVIAPPVPLPAPR